MAEIADEAVQSKQKRREDKRGIGQTIKKRWRAWLRAFHRDAGYIAIGFTIIYALSGIAMNHLEDWDPNFVSSEVQLKIAPVTDAATDDEAVAHIARATGMTDKPSDVFRAGDEVRLEYANGSKVTAIGDTVTMQKRDSRFFFRVANWLHATRGKAAWKYISDAYAVLLLYLAISGIFMIKGKLGLRWRGTILMGVGLGVPLGYIILSGGPDSKSDPKAAVAKTNADGIRMLPPDDPSPSSGESSMPVRKQPPADGDAPQGPPVVKQPPADRPQGPPVRKQPSP